jgi:DUF4097 and DUF4098 domain-containing protein YvlB
MARSKLFFLSLLLAAALPAAAAERSLELRLDEAGPVRIHNLAGTTRLVPGDGDLVIRASISANEQGTADEIRLVTRERGGVVEVVVEYPERISRLRYDGEEFERLDARVEYEGRKVRVMSSRGERVRVDLEIAVPADSKLGVRQGVGPVTAERVRADLVLATRYGNASVTDGTGRLRADTASGRVTVAGFRGDVVADTGSGAVMIENVLGRVEADTGSGSVELRGIDGDIVADTGSGGVRITDARARQVVVDTGSGGVRLQDVAGALSIDTGSGSVRGEGLVVGPELLVDTGSGGVALEGDFAAVRKLLVDTGSGSVDLRSTAPLSLRVDLSSGSGGIRVDVPALSDVEAGRRTFRAVIGSGEGTAKVSTGSGGIRISAP